MIFENIDTYHPPKTEAVTFVQQRYLQNDFSDLRSEKPNEIRIYESNLIPTTLPALPSIELVNLEECRSQLMIKRRQLLDTSFLFLRPNKSKLLTVVESQLDDVENQIIALQKNDRDNEILLAEKFIQDNEKFIQKYNT